MKITSKTINYTVDTVDDLLSLSGEENAVVVVTDENRGGTFIYRASEVGNDNGGTKFNGWCRQYSGAVNVKWFGAKGDGVTDDTVAIQSALDYLGLFQKGGVLCFTEGIYKVTAHLSKTFTNSVKIKIIGYGAKIDGTSVQSAIAGDTTLISLQGERGSSSLLSVSPSKNDLSISTSENIDAVEGDTLLITSTDLWNPAREYYFKGEMVEVQDVDSNTYNISNPLFDDYTASTTTVYKLTMPTITVEGLEIEMDSNQTALEIKYSKNPSIINCKVHGARYTSIRLYYCIGGLVSLNNIRDAWYPGTSTSYGIAIASCQGVIVQSNNISEARHCIASGGREPVRNVTYSNNVCKTHPLEETLMAIDMHGNTELSSIINNITEGISVAGINLVINGNTITGSKLNSNGINIVQEIDSDYYRILDNTITMSYSSNGIWISPSASNLSISNLEVSNNLVYSNGSCIRVAPRAVLYTGCYVDSLKISNNTLKSEGTQAFVCANYTIDNVLSNHNKYKSLSYDAFAITSTSLVTLTISSNDLFLGNRNNGYLAFFSGVDVEIVNPRFEGNINGAGNSRSVAYANTGTVKVLNPYYSNITFKAELTTPVEYLENGWSDATPTILNTSGARLVNFYGSSGRAISYGTSAPTTNTWIIGDRVYNQNPSVGNPTSWVCTVSGTPGTWVSEGNL